jgi:hypothetical protein
MMYNYIRYDTNTVGPNDNVASIISAGFMPIESLTYELESGSPIIQMTLPDDFDLNRYSVNINTGELVENPPAPPPPPPTPRRVLAISDKQFFQKLSIDGIISQQDALSAVSSGFIPSVLMDIIDTVQDPNEKFSMQMSLAGDTVLYRDSDTMEKIRIGLNKTPEEMDQFFSEAIQL